MLTKDDIKQIRTVVREEVENEIDAAKTEIKANTIASRMQIQQNIRELRDRVKNVKIVNTKMHKDIQGIDKKLDRVQEDVAEYLNRLEPRITKVEKRVDNIEDNLDIHSN